MDRLNQLRGEAGDSTLDTSSPPSEAFMSANESSSKYFSLSEVDSTFSISPSKDAPAGPADSDRTITEDPSVITNLSPIPKADSENFKIGKHIEAANILSGGVNIFEDNDNSYDGDELVIDDNVAMEDEKSELKLSEGAAVPLEKDITDDTLTGSLDEPEAIPSKDTEVVLQIDGKNVDAIDIGNGLYLYRKSGEKELSAVQIIDDDQQQPSFKFLKVRENTEGNLEVYEEIQIEIPKEVPPKDGKFTEKTAHVPIKDINKVINEPSSDKAVEKINKTPKFESDSASKLPSESLETQSETKSEVNINGKMVKFNESRKSPLTFTPMTYHSTPNKEGIPLTKTMVDQQLHPNRHSDNIKKTIEVHTDNIKPKINETFNKTKDLSEHTQLHNLQMSIEETDEDKSQITNVEHGRKEMQTVHHALNNDEECFLSNKIKDENESRHKEKESLEINSVSEECAGKTSEINKVTIEEMVSCDEIKQNNDNINNEGMVSKNAEEPQNLNVTLKSKEQEDNHVMTNQIQVKEYNTEINKGSEINMTEMKSETNEIHENNNTDNSAAENLIETNKNVQKEEVLTNEIISNSKVKKDDAILLPGQMVEQVCTEETKLSSASKIKTNIAIKGENKCEPEKKEDSMVNRYCATKSNPIIDPSTTQCKSSIDIHDAIKNDKISDSSQQNMTDYDLSLKKLKDSKDESDNLVKNLNKNEKLDCETKNLQDPTQAIKSNQELQMENVNSSKDLKDNVQEDLVKTKVIHPKKIDMLDSQKIIKPIVDSAKLPTIDKNVTQTMIPTRQMKKIDADTEILKKVATKTNSAVPFGKWTEANRQEFLNKIKESKTPSNNTNQIKQTNDLNRRDVLKKFDSQRQSIASVPMKIPDYGSVPKFSGKMENVAFVNKSVTIQQPIPVKPVIPPLKTQVATVKAKTADIKIPNKEPLNSEEQIINSQELIDKTVEGIITRALKMKTTTPIHMKQQMTIHTVENPKDAMPLPGSLDYIEMKMNELHGFSFVEKPAQDAIQASNHYPKSHVKFEDNNIIKTSKIPNLLPFKATEQHKVSKEPMRDDTSDEEIIEHEPITGDIDVSKQNLISLLSCKEKFTEPKQDSIITETDFDKFAGKNSITYENCLTVNFDGKEKHNVVQTVIEKETSVKKLSRNELLLAESKAKSSNKHNIAARHNNQSSKIPLKSVSEDDAFNKNYQSKVKIAYQSALTAKRNLECPIATIEDKPVKVVFIDTNAEYIPTQLNVQGQELSPSKNKKPDVEVHSASESLDSDILEFTQDPKPLDEKSKSKHQRKQVLTPVEQEPEIQLIEPSDLGIKASPTKKRKIDEKSEKHIKNLVPKKSYLLNRSVIDEHKSKTDQPKTEAFTGHNINTALDNLVKAAELIENQSENNGANVVRQTSETPQNTPIKRGRGRPRKYPLPELGADSGKPPSSQKKPRLIDAKPPKTYSDSDESSDGEVIKENWTMGKINENIVCPICSKLFRSEDVLFKHVKHCTGPSPNRSDSDNRSPRRLRISQESERKPSDSRSDVDDNDMEEENDDEDENLKNHNSAMKPVSDTADVIVIEDTPVKQKPTNEKTNNSGTKKLALKLKSKHLHNTNLVCEFCGKTFRQLSYLVNHKLQHSNEVMMKTKKLESETTNKSVFSCEVCRKEFRKLHHLVQHRIIHNPSSRALRKTSSEVHESRHPKSQNDDASAGFRCEPCDKSFRKLHHLVEHRETHDGINKKGNVSTSQATTDTSKSILAHHCDICKKVFKKLQDLLEHKEQHYDTSSEKSDDVTSLKSVKSSLSTKDIIHECSLCYMVFPNEHSLTKHIVICMRKKKQSAAKQAAKQAEIKAGEENADTESVKLEDDNISQDISSEENNHENETLEAFEEKTLTIEAKEIHKEEQPIKDEADKDVKTPLNDLKYNIDATPNNGGIPKKRHSNASNEKTKTDDVETPAKIKKVEAKERKIIVDTPTPKKKNKDKIAPTVTKKHKTGNSPVINTVISVNKSIESSDDDEIRYMLNPNYKEEENIESKIFMKIRALKRNSLQIERPNSKDLVKRRISLQHPSKMPRLKAKAVESKPKQDIERPKVLGEKKLTPVRELITDSDDSDVKYSFPEQEVKNIQRKVKKQSPAIKRKVLTGVAKRKSLGKTVSPQVKPKKRKSEVEHRCDCGKLFSSAALLARHTTLDHTPPRIRRRRSPPPDLHKHTNTNAKHTNTSAKNTNTNPKNTNTNPKHTNTNTKHTNTNTNTKHTNTITKPISKKPKPDVTNSNKTLGVTTRKSSVSNETKQSDNGKSVKSDSFKLLRSAKSVSVSGKMKKIEKKK